MGSLYPVCGVSAFELLIIYSLLDSLKKLSQLSNLPFSSSTLKIDTSPLVPINTGVYSPLES